MGFLSGLFHSRDKPTNSTNGSAYRFLFGGSNSGKAVNERSAMQMTAVYACVRILSESIAGLPVHVYKYTDSGSKEKATKHPLYRLIRDESNPEMTSFVFRETLMTHLLLYGNAYAQIIRNGKGEVIALYPLMANQISVDRDDKGHLYYQYQMQDSDAPTMKNGTVILKPSDVLHIPGLGFDGLVGYSPIAMAKNAIGLAIPMPGAVSLSLDANGEPSSFYADGYAYYTISNNMGYEGDLELAMIPESFRTYVLKETLDTNKVLVENANVETANFTLLFEFDGDVKKIRYVLYNCAASRPSIESQSNEDEIEV